MKSVDVYGRPVFKSILRIAEEQRLPIHWGSKGFSLNVEVDGKDVALCYAYPPHAVYRQSIYTAFADITRKIEDGGEVVDVFRERIGELRVFTRAGNELKWIIEDEVDNNVIDRLNHIILDIALIMTTHGLILKET